MTNVVRFVNGAVASVFVTFSSFALAQNPPVIQGGQVTPGHVVQWITNGVVGDGGQPGGPIFTGPTVLNDFACVGASGTIIDCGLSATSINNWPAQQNFNGGATAPTRPVTDNTTNVATTAFVASAAVAVNPVLYGADPTGVNDSAAAINAALAVSSYIQFPPGHYKILSLITYTIPTGGHSVTIACSGQDNTFLDWSNGTAGIRINFDSGASSAHVRDCTIETSSAVSGIGLRYILPSLNTLGAASASSDVENVTFRGNDGGGATKAWATALDINNVSNTTLLNVTIFGTAALGGNGVNFLGNSGLSSQAVVLNLVSCTFIDFASAVVYNGFAQGLTVTNSNFTSGGSGINVPGALASQTQLVVTNSQFATASDIQLNSLVTAVAISNNLFIKTSTQNAIILANTQGLSITGNNFAGAGGGTAVGVQIAATVASSFAEIIGNAFHSLNTAINLSGASSAAIIANNDFFSNGTNISNSSTGVLNRIHDNVGYNPVGVTAAANVCASPCTITAGPSPETHYLRQNGTNTATVTKGGQALSTLSVATTYYPFELGPNESIIVTWATTTPTDTKDVH